MRNAFRVAKLDLIDLKDKAIERINCNLEVYLGAFSIKLHEALQNQDTNEVYRLDVLAKELFQLDIDQNRIQDEIILDKPDQKLKILTNLKDNFTSDLDTTIDSVISAIAKRNSLALAAQKSVLSAKFNIELEEILNATELTIAHGVLLGVTV